TLFTIPVVNGTSSFAIVNDDWTGDPMNNGDYYVSLNSFDQTGIIYGLPTTVAEAAIVEAVLEVVPNPTNGPLTVSFTMRDVQQAELRILDPAGRLVMQRSFGSGASDRVERFDLYGLSKGAYLVQLERDGELVQQRIIKH
ncbi:MAG: T9SS type A sorting domain-containing protein, partial [Flavobacteriales bacterium]|nr:T9SS type A sorting domain-containing protein [Flavobacteriales bacterium]